MFENDFIKINKNRYNQHVLPLDDAQRGHLRGSNTLESCCFHLIGRSVKYKSSR